MPKSLSVLKLKLTEVALKLHRVNKQGDNKVFKEFKHNFWQTTIYTHKS